MKRLLSLLVVASLLLCSCGAPKTKDYFSFKESSDTEHSNALRDSDIVMTVNGYDLNYSELYYYMSVLDADKADIEAKVLPEMLLSRSIALMAEEAEISLTKEEYKELASYLDETAKDENYVKQLALGAMTDSLFRFLALQSQLTAKVYEHYTNEATTPIKASDDIILDTAKNGELIRIKHIMIQVDESTTENLAKVEAEAILQKLKNGESFDELITLHSDYDSQNDAATGEYIYRYEMPDQFEAAAFSLKEGEMSGVVHVVSDAYIGYHIITRLPVDPSYVEKNLDTLRTNYMASKFYETAYRNIEKMEIEYTENFDKV